MAKFKRQPTQVPPNLEIKICLPQRAQAISPMRILRVQQLLKAHDVGLLKPHPKTESHMPWKLPHLWNQPLDDFSRKKDSSWLFRHGGEHLRSHDAKGPQKSEIRNRRKRKIGKE